MKRLFFILLFFSLLFHPACARRYGILDYQSKSIVAECVVNDKFKVEITKTEKECKIQVKAPENVKGIEFLVGEGVSLRVGDMVVQMNKDSLKGICALGGVFSQREELLISAVQRGEESELTFKQGECTYILTVGKNSLPKRAVIVSQDFEYTVEILGMEIK